MISSASGREISREIHPESDVGKLKREMSRDDKVIDDADDDSSERQHDLAGGGGRAEDEQLQGALISKADLTRGTKTPLT